MAGHSAWSGTYLSLILRHVECCVSVCEVCAGVGRVSLCSVEFVVV